MTNLSLQEIKDILEAEEANQRIQEVLEGVADEKEKQELAEWIGHRKEAFIKRCEVVTDKDEIPWLVMWYYIQLKAEWSQINTEIQYGAMNSGAPDLQLVYKSSLLSTLIAVAEEIPRHVDVEHATNFLAEPFSKMMGM